MVGVGGRGARVVSSGGGWKLEKVHGYVPCSCKIFELNKKLVYMFLYLQCFLEHYTH